MGKNLLFEIGSEEIPAKFMPDILEQIKTVAQNKFSENRVGFKNIKSLGTPRRIALLVEGLTEKQEELDEMVKGPARKIAFDENGQLTKAGLGFIKSQGVEEENVVIQKKGDIEYIFAKKHLPGKDTKEVLKTVLPEIIFALNFPKSMRWRDYSLRFARPIRWIVALLDKEVIEFSIEGAASSNITRGHRTLSNYNIELDSADKYVDILNNEHVMVEPEERKKVILEQINRLAESKNGKVLVDEELLEEVIYLVEYPTALIGNFEDEFLELPKEAVITPMKEHQRYFPVVDGNKLLPYFITVRNGDDRYLDIVKSGNERVLRARLKDAQFFYNEDLKDKFENKVEKLKTIVYQAKLGTIYEKVERISKIAEFIGTKLNLSAEHHKMLQRAAYLCKADLVTGMVCEFDELQGIMGKEYALKNGETKEVAEAIYSHYLPRFSGDDTPKDVFGQILSISDKLDSIVGSFGIGVHPTGSQDPYGLRRQALGIVSVIMDNNLQINFDELVSYVIGLLKDKISEDRQKVKNDTIEFFKQRIRMNLIDKGIRYDLTDAVLNTNLEDIRDVNIKVKELSKVLETENFNDFIAAFTRVSNLASKTCSDDIKEQLFENEFEKTLYSEAKVVKTVVQDKLHRKLYSEALSAMYNLINPINNFFDNIMVMVENDNVKNNRLALLKYIVGISESICDFKKIKA